MTLVQLYQVAISVKTKKLRSGEVRVDFFYAICT